MSPSSGFGSKWRTTEICIVFCNILRFWYIDKPYFHTIFYIYHEGCISLWIDIFRKASLGMFGQWRWPRMLKSRKPSSLTDWTKVIILITVSNKTIFGSARGWGITFDPHLKKYVHGGRNFFFGFGNERNRLPPPRVSNGARLNVRNQRDCAYWQGLNRFIVNVFSVYSAISLCLCCVYNVRRVICSLLNFYNQQYCLSVFYAVWLTLVCVMPSESSKVTIFTYTILYYTITAFIRANFALQLWLV